MSSQLKIESNRRNSQKSTGPRTAAGKAASSLNHTKSGLYAQSQIIAGERQSDFEDLAEAFTSRYLPGSAVEHSLLDIAIHSEWILRRLRRAETGIWDYFIDDHDYGDGATALGRAFDCNDRTFNRLQRRLDSLQRNFHRAIKELDRLRSARPGPQPESPPQPKPAAQESVIGFVPPAATAAKPLAPASSPAASRVAAAPLPPTPPAIFGFESSPNLVPLTKPALPLAPPTHIAPPAHTTQPARHTPPTSPAAFGFESSTSPAPAFPLPPVTMEKPCP